MMRLTYLPACQRWFYFFGFDWSTASVVTLANAERSFATRAEAVTAARYLGLTVSKSGKVTVA